jgi:energy-coupling factor transporter ATP-binding protein EcfA2
MAWLAHMIQKPGADKPGTAIAIRGPQGCGKGTLTKWIQAIIGTVHSMKISTGDRLTGRFNSHLMDKIFINADEAIWSGDRKIAGTLKALITESPLDFEQKGVNPISLPSYLRIIFTSNEKWMIPAEQDDRRFVVLDCGTSHVKDKPYYNALNEQMENGGAVELYHTLLEWDYSEVDVRQAPSTKALIAQKLESLPTVDRWWYSVLYRGSIASTEYVVEGEEDAPPPWLNDRQFFVTQDMHKAYADSLKGSGRRVVDDVAFGRRLKELTGVAPKRSARGGPRRKGFDFPALPVCRAGFEQFMAATSADLDWPAAE